MCFLPIESMKAIDVKNLYRVEIASSLNIFISKSANAKLTDEIRNQFRECVQITKSGISIPNLENLTHFLSVHSSIREFEVALSILEQLNRIEFNGKTPAKGTKFSTIQKCFYMTEFSKIPGYVDFMAMPRTAAAICCSYNLEEYNRIASVVNSGLKFSNDSETETIFEIFNDIVESCYPDSRKVPIVKCSIPIIEILLSIKKNFQMTDEQESNAISLLKFVMVLEKFSADHKPFDFDVSIIDFIKSQFPFRKFDGINKEMFGIGNGSNNHEMIANGKIMDEKFKRHNLVIAESFLLSLSWRHLFQHNDNAMAHC